MADLAQLRQEFTTLHTRATAIVEKATTEGRDLTPEEATSTDADFARMKTIKAIEDNNAKLAEYAFAKGKVEQPSTPPGREEQVRIEVRDNFEHLKNPIEREKFFKTNEGRQMYNKAVNDWARTGEMDPRFKFTTISTSTGSGILLPQDVLPPVVIAASNTLRQALAAYGIEAWNTPTTRPITIPVPTYAAGGAISQTGTSATENEPTFPGIVTTPATYGSNQSWVSNLELNALDYDLVSALTPGLLYAKELSFESAAMGTISGDSNITQHATTIGNSSNTSNATMVAYNDLVSLHMALPKRYCVQRVIVLNKAVYSRYESLVSTTGQPILTPDVNNSELKRFQGSPVVYTESLSDIGATGTVVGFVTSLMGFRLRDCGQARIVRYPNYPLKQNQTGFECFQESAIGYDPSAMALLKNP